MELIEVIRIAEIEAARARLAGIAVRTPLVRVSAPPVLVQR